MKRLIIVGAGGHGKVVADCAMKIGYTNIGFVDDCITGACMDIPIVGTCADIAKLDDGKTKFVIAIGNNAIRKIIAEKYHVDWTTLIHPDASVAGGTYIENGTVIMAGAVINACARIGAHCIINTGAIVEHDNVIEDFVHISPGVRLGGTVHIAEQTHVGIGAIVSNNISVCDKCTIGAGAVVVRTIEQSGTYIGIPARLK